MKYSEFREYLKIIGIYIQEDEERLIAAHQFEISKIEEHRIVFLIDVIDFPYEYEMLKKVIELAETPLKERGDEKKYYLKHKFINTYSKKRYVNFVTNEGVILSDRHEDQHFKTKFTKAEIEELKEKFDTDLRDFELLEVEEG